MLIVAGIIGFIIGGGAVHVYHRYGTQIRSTIHERSRPPQ
jgi:hypothetical protein